MKALVIVILLGSALTVLGSAEAQGCQKCYHPGLNMNCKQDEVGLESYTLHMSVHPHLDAFWIFNFESYYSPQPQEGVVRGYFDANRFTSVKQIFSTALEVLWKSKQIRQAVNKTQEAHRSFFNSEMGFFKRWYREQSGQNKGKVKELLKTKYWEILGGGMVEHDQGCAYYDDIIENFQLGLNFLKTELDYYPRVAISADSFGHSQSTLALLAHLGIEGFLVQRLDEHILLQNKTEFLWRARSANGHLYGALPTHIRWAIHGFEDQFISGSNGQLCSEKEGYFRNMRDQNSFLKRILKSSHILRYFGHDFQEFNDYSYQVIETTMEQFSKEKCNRVVAIYGNPTEYFMALMGQVAANKVKQLPTRSQDIFPIWDYDSGLYWTGYFTTDAYHKLDYRSLGRLLRATRKFFLPLYTAQPTTQRNKQYYQVLEETAEQVAYLQHHDGISGTSKYKVMDQLQDRNRELYKIIDKKVLADIFEQEFPLGTAAPIFTCHLGKSCSIPANTPGDVYLKVLNSDGAIHRDPIVVDLPFNEYYLPDCDYELNCFCVETACPCKLYLYPSLATYSSIRLTKQDTPPTTSNSLQPFTPSEEYSHTDTHFRIKHSGREYLLGYKRVKAGSTDRHYEHLSRYGGRQERSFSIRPGKYALGNDPNDIKDFSSILRVSSLQSQRYRFFLIHWHRYGMKTIISIPSQRSNEWRVDTISATEGYQLSDLYFEVITPINNDKKFVTDSNGWLTVPRQLFKHQDYQAHFSKDKFDDIDGNTYPATAFAYIQDSSDKVSINIDRPQGVIAYRRGTLWVNFDRLSQDDGKWVYESAYRSEYQRYTHIVTVMNKDYNQRRIQRLYDQPLLIQANLILPTQRIEPNLVDSVLLDQWNSIANLRHLKFTLRPFNDSTTILRVHNLHDTEETVIGLFANHHSPLLTTFYERTVTFSSVSEQALGGNMEYSKFINSKWNWAGIVDMQNQNKIFNKIFRENITLAPLEIRTFLFKDLKFDDQCISPEEVKYNQQQIVYSLDRQKPHPTRDAFSIVLEKEIINYMKDGDHCRTSSPVLNRTNMNVIETPQNDKAQKVFETKPLEKPVLVTATSEIVGSSADKAPESPSSSISSLIKAVTPSFDLTPILTDTTTPVLTPTSPIIPTVNQDDLIAIQGKVQNLQKLTVLQKQIYFSAKIEAIRRNKATKSLS